MSFVEAADDLRLHWKTTRLESFKQFGPFLVSLDITVRLSGPTSVSSGFSRLSGDLLRVTGSEMDFGWSILRFCWEDLHDGFYVE